MTRSPQPVARYAHARLRTDWIRALSVQPGFEIVAMQALRNSLMSAAISVSTAALAVMGAVSVSGGALAANLGHWSTAESLHTVPLVLMLFACFVSLAMATRSFGHASFIMSMSVAAPQRHSR